MGTEDGGFIGIAPGHRPPLHIREKWKRNSLPLLFRCSDCCKSATALHEILVVWCKVMEPWSQSHYPFFLKLFLDTGLGLET